MGKKRKSEKLAHVLGEIKKLKSDVKALAKQQATLSVHVDALSAKKAAPRPARKTAAKTATKPKAKSKPTGATVARKASAASKRPVLVAPPDAATG